MSVIRDLWTHRSAGRRDRVAFVLGGGGNLGAIQVGMARALIEAGVVPDLVVGCSVGALNAAAIAGDPDLGGVSRLERLWNGLRSDDIFPAGRLKGPWQLALRGESICSNDRLRAVIERWLPYSAFEQTRVPLHVVATSLRTGREHWFTSGRIVEPLLASAALPAILPPVPIGDDLYIDGGVVDNVPVSRAIASGAKRIYVLHVGNFERRRRVNPRRPLDVLVQAFSIARTYRFKAEAENVPEGVEMITMPGIDPGTLRYNDFSRSTELIARAHSAGRAFLSLGVDALSSGNTP